MAQQQVVTSVSPGEWVSLGAGPLLVQCLSSECKYAIGDSRPTTFLMGFEPTIGPFLFNTASLVWAAHTQPPGIGVEDLSVNSLAINASAVSNLPGNTGHFVGHGNILTTFELMEAAGSFTKTNHSLVTSFGLLMSSGHFVVTGHGI